LVHESSDLTGTHINNVAFDHMSNADKVRTMHAFGWMIAPCKRQFGAEFSGKMADWYNEYSGWKETWEIYSNRLAQINFPEYQAHYGGDLSSHRKSFEPTFDYSKFPETQRLYDEQQVCWGWACATYGAMVKAQQQQTGMAVSSLSGDLIKLITDRCLVPNITPAGVSSGLAAQLTTLSTKIIGHYENILGNIDNIQTLVLGEKMDAANVRVVIESLSDVIDQHKAIIDKCEERMRAIKDEIDTLGPKLAEEQRKNAEQSLNAQYAEMAAVEENSPITTDPNTSIASWNAQHIAEYNNMKRSDYKTDAEYQSAREAKRNAIVNYNQNAYNQAITDLASLCSTYFGSTDTSTFTDESVVGSFLKKLSKVPSFSPAYDPQPNTTVLDSLTWGSLNQFPKGKGFGVNTTEEQLATVDKEVRDYANQNREYFEKCIPLYQEAQETATNARKELNRINGVLRAVDKGYYTASAEQEAIAKGMDRYVRGLGKLYQDRTVAGAQAAVDYFAGEFLDCFDKAKDALVAAQEGIRAQTARYKQYQDEYAEAWQEYRELEEERTKVLDEIPDELQWLCDDVGGDRNDTWEQLFGKNPTATAADVARVGTESDDIMKRLLLLDERIGLSVWKIQLSANAQQSLCRVQSPAGSYEQLTALGRTLDYGEESLRSGATLWQGIAEKEWNENQASQDWNIDLAAAYIYDGVTFQSTLRSAPFAEWDLASIRNDFDGKTHAHDRLVEIFVDMSDNVSKYSSTKSDGEDGYVRLKEEAEYLGQNPSYLSEAAAIVPKPGSASTATVDPYDDLVAPLIKSIDSARIASGIDPAPDPVPIAKKTNPMVVKGQTKTGVIAKGSTLAQATAVSGCVKFDKKAKGTVTYTRVADGSSKYLSVSKTTGKVTVKKGTKAGTYKIKVKVTAAGTSTYAAKSTTVTVTVKVKPAK
jgi:uncharacterized coiled-coil protein SlyX